MNNESDRNPAIYALTCDGGVFYVGKTNTNTQERLWQHVYRARSGHSAPVYVWMREVGIKNVEIVTLENFEIGYDASDLEAKWILKMLQDGNQLMNQIGRDGVANSISAEMRERMGVALRGKPSWIKGKRGEEAGWTQARREAHNGRPRGPRKEKVERATHGKPNHYRKGCRCDPCVSAHDAAKKLQNEKRRANRLAEGKKPLGPRPYREIPLYRVHGTVACYKNGKCRCEKCSSAYREYKRRLPRRE